MTLGQSWPTTLQRALLRRSHGWVSCGLSLRLKVIAVDPTWQGSGLGTVLKGHAESHLAALGEDEARCLIVETSSTDQYTVARRFYAGLGHDEEARIREFYGPDDHKVIFWKSLLG